MGAMRFWNSVSILGSWFVLTGAGFILRDFVVFSDRELSVGGPVAVLIIGLGGLEFSRRRLEAEGQERRPLWLHIVPTLVVALPMAVGTIWWATGQGESL